jgi:VWFA-related protein
MRIWITSLLSLSLGVTFVLPFNARAQKPEVKEQEVDRIVVGTNEVVLDAVVKDKKGRPVKDLSVSDFEVFEDGAPQQIKSFQLVTRDSGSSRTTGTEPETKPNDGVNKTDPNVVPAPGDSGSKGPLTNPHRIGAMALVFDRLSPNGRNIARQAALNYLEGGMRPDDFVGVFGIDLSLKVLQKFTNNEALVRQAVERGVSHSSSSYAPNTEQIAKLGDTQAALQTQVDQSASGAGETSDPSSSIGAAAAAQQFAAMTQNILEGFDRLEKNQQGFATTDGLLAIISELGNLPGRKALVFFSEGVVLPTSVMAHYRSVISNANRANVSIYSVDAAGLRAMSSDSQTGSALTKLGQARLRQAGQTRDNFGSMMKDLERNEDLMRSDPDGALRDLAQATGGLLIANTNDPGPRLRQVTEDLHSYYLLTYTSRNANYDGRFRQIALKVNRPGIDLQTRKGYYAIDGSYGTPILSYEAPALAVLSGPPQRNFFRTRLAAFSFPEPDKLGLVPVVVEIPPGSISFSVDKGSPSYRTDFSVVVLIKDESHRVVRKLSNQYILTGSVDQLASTKDLKVIFYRQTDLNPGRYAVASIVHDAITGHSSVETGTVIVPSDDPSRLRLSSIVLIKSAEPAASTTPEVKGPFQFGEVLLLPNLGEPVSKSGSKELRVFVTIYPPRGDSTAPMLALEISKNGKAVGHLSYNLPKPDQSGRIQYASSIGLDKIQPGEYELKITVQDGVHTATRSEHVRVAP